MLLSLVLHMHSVRCVLPAAVLLGTAPTYVLVWGAWRLLSALLPSRFYQAVDDRLYCVYQSMVLFFFENYTGVQVRPLRAGRRPCRCRGARRRGWGSRAHLPASTRPVSPSRCKSDPANTCRHPILALRATFTVALRDLARCFGAGTPSLWV